MNTSRASRTKLTYEDFLHFPDDGRRHELIDGKHYVTASPNIRHQELSVRMTVVLANSFAEHGGGKVFHAPLDCVFTTVDIVEPDLVIVLGDQPDILTEQHVRGAPAIVIEILSPGTSRRDQGIKRALYARGGVREYWMVDPRRDSVTVLGRLRDAGLCPLTVLSAAAKDTLTTALLPGFSLRLRDFFSRE